MTTNPPFSHLVEHLNAAIVAASEKIDSAEQAYQAAKAKLAAAKAEMRQLEASLAPISDRPRSATLTKDFVRPYIQRVLADGPMSRAQTSDKVQVLLREDGFARTGIAFSLNGLKSEFESSDGSWKLPTIDKPMNNNGSQGKESRDELA